MLSPLAQELLRDLKSGTRKPSAPPPKRPEPPSDRPAAEPVVSPPAARPPAAVRFEAEVPSGRAETPSRPAAPSRSGAEPVVPTKPTAPVSRTPVEPRDDEIETADVVTARMPVIPAEPAPKVQSPGSAASGRVTHMPEAAKSPAPAEPAVVRAEPDRPEPAPPERAEGLEEELGVGAAPLASDSELGPSPLERLDPFAAARAKAASGPKRATPVPEIPDQQPSLPVVEPPRAWTPAASAPAPEPAPAPRPAAPPRLSLKVGRAFVASLALGLIAHLASGMLAGAAAGGAAYVIAGKLVPDVAQIIAFSAFLVVMALWTPSALGLANRYAWRTALREPGAAHTVAEVLASSLVPAGNDGQTGLDASGLGLYRLRERVRAVVEQALSSSLKTQWLRRLISFLTSSGVDRAVKRYLGTVEDMDKLDRGAVRRAIAHAIQSALVGAG